MQVSVGNIIADSNLAFERLKEVVQVCSKYGITILIETPYHSMYSNQILKKLFDQGYCNVGYCLNIASTALGNYEYLKEKYEALAPWVRMVQLNDNVLTDGYDDYLRLRFSNKWNQTTIWGQGDSSATEMDNDSNNLLEKLQLDGFTGAIIFDYASGDTTLTDNRKDEISLSMDRVFSELKGKKYGSIENPYYLSSGLSAYHEMGRSYYYQGTDKMTNMSSYIRHFDGILEQVYFLNNIEMDVPDDLFYGLGSGNGTRMTLHLPYGWTGTMPDENGMWYGGQFSVIVPGTLHGEVNVKISYSLPHIATVTCNIDEGYVLKSIKYNDGTDHPFTLDPDTGKYEFELTKEGIVIYADFGLPHSHNIVKVNGQSATELEAGYKDYYECNCGIFFEDENGAVEIGDEAALIVWKAESGNGYIAPTGIHNLVLVPGLANSELNAGCKDAYKCSECGKYFEDENGAVEIGDEAALTVWKVEGGNGYIAPTGIHHFVLVSGLVPTEENDGYKDAYKCSECGKYFKDENGTVEIGDEASYTEWIHGEGKLPALTKEGLGGGAIAAIIIFSILGLLIIAFIVLYILWREYDINVPILCIALTPAFRFINKLLFKTPLNKVELKEESDKDNNEDSNEDNKEESSEENKEDSVEEVKEE